MKEKEIFNGIYEGRYIDARGFRSEVKMTLKGDDGQFLGEFDITLYDEHSKESFSGPIKGERVHTKNKVSVWLQLPERKEGLELELDITEALPYAETCMFGCVNNTESKKFGGGVWILWKFHNS